MQYRPDLDGLRAVAVILVLLYHANVPLPGAFLGVDIFFTLSGYLITTLTTSSLNDNTFTLSSFYTRRSLRLFPAVIIVITLTALAALAVLPLHAAHQTVVSAIAAIASVGNIRFLMQSGYFDDESITKPLLHTWSLAVEEQFYLVWPFLLLFSHRYLPTRAPLFFSSFVILISPYLSHLLIQKYPAAAFYLAPARFYELLIGAALSFIHPPSSSVTHEIFGITGSIGLFTSVAYISAADEFPSWRALVPCVSAALLIHAGPHSFISKMLSLQPLVFIGTISYSVYLVHWPVIVFYRLLTGQDQTFGMGERLLMLGAAFVLGYPLNALVENRFRVLKEPKYAVHNIAAEEPALNLSPRRNSSGSTQACRRLSVTVLLVQVGLFLAAGALDAQKSKVRLSTSLQPFDPSLNDSYSSVDDYHGFDIDSVLRLADEVETSRPEQLQDSTLSEYVSRIYYENGSVPEGFTQGANPDIPRILFIGDSHAKHWKSLAYHISKEFQAHVEMWYEPGCAPLFNVFNVYLSNPERAMPCWNDVKIWRENLSAQPFDTIVISGRWTPLVEKDRFGNTAYRKTHILVEENAPEEKRKGPTDPKEWGTVFNESRRLFRKSLLETVEFLTGLGSRVVLMNQVPVLRRGPKGCTSRPSARAALEARKQPKECGSPKREQTLSRMQYVGAVMNEAKRMNEKMVDVVFPSDLFCDNFLQDEERCRTVLKDFLLYKDTHHLSLVGASFFAMRWKTIGYGGVPWRFRAQKNITV